MALVFPSSPTPGATYAAPNGITYTWDNTLGVWTASANSLAAASLAEAATGTINTKFSSPQTAVPKDASGMTGAAILPSGTLLQRPATPVAGMQRFNTDSGYEEVYTGATLGWQRLLFVTEPSPPLTDVTLSGATSLNSSYVCNNFTVSAGATLTSTGTGVVVRARGNVTINASTWTLVGIRKSRVGGGPFPSNFYGEAGGGYGGGGIPAAGVSYSPYAQLGGSVGGFGGAPTSGFVGTAGNAGGYVVIIADGNITFNGVVAINCPGENAGGGADSGCGGGSGGTIIVQTPLTLTTPATVTFNVSGGNGAAGTAGGGGGGGGGGWVILQAGNLVDSSTKTLTAGTGGAGVPGSTGGGGGGNAGGGGISSASAAGAAGTVGIFQTYGSPY